jgi:type IV pilus assembly protein PilC
MKHWKYEATDPRGQIRKGRVLASTEEDARASVLAMGLQPLAVGRSQDIELPWQNRRPGLKDRALFTQQFAQMLGSGSVSQSEALAVSARTTTNKQLREAIENVRKDIDEGHPIDEVVARKTYAHAFDPVFVAFMRMGAEGGNISPSLKELSEMYKWQLRIVGMVKKGLTLPAVIALACLLVTYFIMAKVVPTFMGILDGLNTELPPLTLMVKKVSGLAANPYITVALIASVVGLTYAVMQYRKTPSGRYRTDEVALRAPVFGPLLRTFILARVSRGLSVMLRNGIPLDDALQITGGLAANEVYRKHFQEIRRQAIDGQKMFPVMAAAPAHFPEQYWLQFRAAEEKAKLKETLDYLGEMYNDEVTNAVESLTATIEPFLMIFLGGVVGVIVVSVFLPMTTMMQALQQ